LIGQPVKKTLPGADDSSASGSTAKASATPSLAALESTVDIEDIPIAGLSASIDGEAAPSAEISASVAELGDSLDLYDVEAQTVDMEDKTTAELDTSAGVPAGHDMSAGVNTAPDASAGVTTGSSSSAASPKIEALKAQLMKALESLDRGLAANVSC
jgi:hypothetical protein